MATLEAAWDAGTRAFDTAPHYGVGLSEERLGKFLRGRDRSEFVVSTKVGRLLVASDDEVSGVEGFYETPQRTRVLDYSASGVLRSIEDSCERLGLECIDIALIHDPDNFEDAAFNEAYPALVELRERGVVKAIGLGMNQVPMVERFVRETDIDCALVAGRYSLLNDDIGPAFFELCENRNVALLLAGVFNSGVLANPSPEATYNYQPVSASLLGRVEAIRAACERFGVSLRVAAVQYALRAPSVAAVVVGARSPEEAVDDIACLYASPPDELFRELRDLQLIERNAGRS